MAAFRVRTPDGRGAAEIVAAARKPFADVPDALEALHTVPCGILPVVFVAELGKVALEDRVQLVAAAGYVAFRCSVRYRGSSAHIH